jgi:hypothetical protein
VTFDGTSHICDNCGEVIEKTGGYDWAGGVPGPGEMAQHFHISREFPECRARSGIDGDADLTLAERIELALAESFTAPGPSGYLPQFRVTQAMARHLVTPDGFPALAPVTPRDAAVAIMAALRKAGLVP